jgi:hypothetical protein
MSATDLTIAPSPVERPVASADPPGTAFPWGRVLVACAVLVAAAGARWLQARQVQAVLNSGRTAPFALKTLPKRLGAWTAPEDGEGTLDPEVAQITGAVDYVKRHYVNDQTGVGVDVLVLYGPATIAHRPEICYPGAGYQLVDGPRIRKFAVPGGQAVFLSLIFAKGEEGAPLDRQQVFYALRYPGHYPGLSDQWTYEFDYKRIARVPGLYKIQLTRRVGEQERYDISNPCEAFLEAMLPEMEQRISGRP